MNNIFRLKTGQNDLGRALHTYSSSRAPLRRFVVEKNINYNWKDFVEHRYEIAIVYYAMSQHRQVAEELGEALDERNILVTNIVESILNGIGQMLMPTIISDDQLDRITD